MIGQRWFTWVGVALGFVTISVVSRADEAAAEATLREVKATIRKNTHVPRKPITHVLLQSVDGRRRHLRPEDLKALKELKDLRYLDLAHSDLTDAGLYELQGMTNLRTLGLHNTHVTDVGMKYVNQITGLRELYLGQDRISDPGLADLKDLKELRSLSLTKTQVTDHGMTALKGFTNLESLLLDDTQVGDTGVYELIGLPNLNNLILNRSRVTDETLKLIPYFKSLQHVQVWDTRGITDAGAAKLRAELPKLDLGRSDIFLQAQPITASPRPKRDSVNATGRRSNGRR